MKNKYFIFYSLALLCLMSSCKKNQTLFVALNPSKTGIHFINKVEENNLYNVLDYMNLYTGAGVAAGDVNNDGLTDLFFSGNEVSGRLYINKGNLQFEDVTEKSGIKSSRWQTGVSMVDINQDGWMDIYVNVSGNEKFGNLSNQLFINNQNGTFSEKAEAYGIAEKNLTMHSSFFDYDRDGDLDLFLITNPADELVSGINNIQDRKINGESKGTDILYRNNGNQTFSDVSKEAGILIEGYSLGAAISDFNNDGWPDIYVSNDFLSSDILYINNKNGTFTDELQQRVKHTSFASMGNDVADFNNDGLTDIFVLDMLPEDNYRKKIIIPPSSYDKFQLALSKGYTPAYSRNTLQLNNGNGSFSEISFLSGLSSTDWSWSALWGDYDNDGDKDLMVTNGFYRDLGNLDYINYQARLRNPMGKQTARKEEKLKAIHSLKKIPLHDYLFENKGQLQFQKRSEEWGFIEPGFSNGACYADLDNDGDLELVINQFNAEAKIYQNISEQLHKNHYFKIELAGPEKNRQGIGTKIFVHTGSQMQLVEMNPYRGFESSVEPKAHFGIGSYTKVDSVKIEWPDGKKQSLYNCKTDTTIKVSYAPNVDTSSYFKNKLAGTYQHTEEKYTSTLENSSKKYFENVAQKLGIDYVHEENEYVDFKVQPLLPKMYSQGGPGIAVGDVNGDGIEDFYIGAASGSRCALYIQNRYGKFTRRDFPKPLASEDMGSLFFDADGDGDQDLYVVSGGSENNEGSAEQQDRIYINNGNGQFKPSVLPDTRSSGSCVVGADYDRDGDMDLFVGGRVTPGSYPLPCRSYLLRNDTKIKDHPVFTDITPKDLQKPGMVCAANWTDIDNDNWADLIITGEFMPLRIYRNQQGSLKETTKAAGLDLSAGWWNCITSFDIDHDGDMDLVAGNLGLNTRHKASFKEPLCIYAKDFDKNGRIDPIMCYYVQGKNYIYPTRDEMIKQINSIRLRFPTYESYATSTFEESFTKTELQDAYVVKSYCFESSVFINNGKGTFNRKPLPVEAQIAPIFGIIQKDLNGDGKEDLILTGNDYATEASTGRYDAMKGVALLNLGKGNFSTDPKFAKGLNISNDSKGLAIIYTADNHPYLLVSNNNDSMQVINLPPINGTIIKLQSYETKAKIIDPSGLGYYIDMFSRSNYLSSGSRKFELVKGAKLVSIIDSKGRSHEIIQK